jgi:hypothetical protein
VTVSPLIFLPLVCSPTEEAGKKVQISFLGDLTHATGFLQRSLACHMRHAFARDLRHATGFLQRSAACHYRNGAKDKISFYKVNEKFSKILAF